MKIDKVDNLPPLSKTVIKIYTRLKSYCNKKNFFKKGE